MGPLQPLPIDARHPADYRDELEHAQVATVLAELPSHHPARMAYYTGAREAADSLSLGHLLAEVPHLVDRLTAAYMGHTARIQAWNPGASGFASAGSGPR